jgi:PadR family transcriptional regulator PadR
MDRHSTSPPGDQQRLKGNLDLLLLSLLARGPAHGYAVIAALRDRSEGTFDLPEGTVYPALHRLERARLLSARWQRGEDAAGGRRRKVYVLTTAGEAALSAERSRWQRFTAGMGAVLQADGLTADGLRVDGRRANGLHPRGSLRARLAAL